MSEYSEGEERMFRMGRHWERGTGENEREGLSQLLA